MHRFRLSWFMRRRKYILTGLLLVTVAGILLSVSFKITNTLSSLSLPLSLVKNRKSLDFKDIVSDDFILQEMKKRRQLRRTSGPRMRGNNTQDQSELSPRSQRDLVENRIRSLKSLMGGVVFKDVLFTPKYPRIWGKGYSEKKAEFDKLLGSKEQNSDPTQLGQGSKSDYLKTVLAESKKRRQESREERKKMDPKTRLQNDLRKLMAFQSKYLSKKKDAENNELDRVIEEIDQQPIADHSDCSSPLCKQYLTTEDSSRFQYCMQKANLEMDDEPKTSILCRFMNGSKRHPVALAGYPASGHLQVRRLFQHVTRLCTGGVNCDINLRRNGFPGEYITSGAVLVAESTQSKPCWIGDPCSKSAVLRREKEEPSFHSAVYLVRNPLNAMREIWMNSKENPGNLDKFVANQTLQWQQSVLSWMLDVKSHSILVVKYEDFVENTLVELKRMLDFLQVPYKSFELEMAEFYNEDTLHQERSQPQFSEENRNKVLSVVQNTMRSLKEAGLSNTCDLSSYMKA